MYSLPAVITGAVRVPDSEVSHSFTIALGDEASTGVLKQIAADHGGSYRVIH